MAYVRWSEKSDIYVYLNSNGYFCCCQCPMYDYDGKFYNTEDIVGHITDHVQLGHKTEEMTIERLKRDKIKNDLWIKKMMRVYGGSK